MTVHTRVFNLQFLPAAVSVPTPLHEVKDKVTIELSSWTLSWNLILSLLQAGPVT